MVASACASVMPRFGDPSRCTPKPMQGDAEKSWNDVGPGVEHPFASFWQLVLPLASHVVVRQYAKADDGPSQRKPAASTASQRSVPIGERLSHEGVRLLDGQPMEPSHGGTLVGADEADVASRIQAPRAVTVIEQPVVALRHPGHREE